MKEKYKVKVKEYHNKEKEIRGTYHFFVTEREAKLYILGQMAGDKVSNGKFYWSDYGDEKTEPTSADDLFYEVEMEMDYGRKVYEVDLAEY